MVNTEQPIATSLASNCSEVSYAFVTHNASDHVFDFWVDLVGYNYDPTARAVRSGSSRSLRGHLRYNPDLHAAPVCRRWIRAPATPIRRLFLPCQELINRHRAGVFWLKVMPHIPTALSLFWKWSTVACWGCVVRRRG